MPKQLNVRVSDLQFSALDDAVASGRFPSRAAALRSAIELLLTDTPATDTPAAGAEPAGAAAGSEAEVIAALAEVAQAAEEEPGESVPDEAAAVVATPASWSVEGGAVDVPAAVAAHPALVEQRVWTWAHEGHLPAPVERSALALARRAAVPVLSGAAGALLASVLRAGAARREQARRAAPPTGEAARGALHLFVVTRRG